MHLSSRDITINILLSLLFVGITFSFFLSRQIDYRAQKQQVNNKSVVAAAEVVSTQTPPPPPSRILLTPENKSTYINQACLDKFSYEEADQFVDYRNETSGIEMKIPYNEQWGNEKYKLQPYDQVSGHIEFGPVYSFEACTLARKYKLEFVPKQAMDEVFQSQKAARKKKPAEWFDGPRVEKVNNMTVIESTSGTPCSIARLHIIGVKSNYVLSSTCGDGYNHLEEIAQTINFIE